MKALVGKTVTVTGEGFAPHATHHHRPIVVDAKTIAAKESRCTHQSHAPCAESLEKAGILE